MRTSLPIFMGLAWEQNGFDRRKLLAVGYSNDVNICVSLLLIRPGALGDAPLSNCASQVSACAVATPIGRRKLEKSSSTNWTESELSR
jgi:hypothetical protein